MTETDASTATPWWVAGWNMPGCLPEAEPESFNDWQDAMGHLIDAIDRFWDQDQDIPDTNLDADGRWAEIHAQTNLATYGEPWSWSNGDNSLTFWINRNEDYQP